MPAIVTASDVSAASSDCGPEFGRRFSLTVAEAALQRMGPAAVQYITQRLAEQIAHEQHAIVEATVRSFLQDRAWAEPIIRDAIVAATRAFVTEMLRGRWEEAGA